MISIRCAVVIRLIVINVENSLEIAWIVINAKIFVASSSSAIVEIAAIM